MNAADIRSLLFVPGDSDRKAAKAMDSAADAVILDLEDAVAPQAKDQARQVTRAVLDGASRRGKPVFVRINALGSGLALHDLAAIVGGKPWGIVLPKCDNAGDLDLLSHYLDVLEVREGIEPRSVAILAIGTETASATLNLGNVHRDHNPRLWGIMWGGEDLSASLGAQANRDGMGRYTFPFQIARSQCLYAANAAQVVAVDAVHPAFRDLDALAQEAAEAARDGFVAKAAIHPDQVDIINRAFSPTAEQVAWSRQVMELLADVAVARLGGGMIDLAHKRIAERILKRAARRPAQHSSAPRPGTAGHRP
jgi:citrate lyase subunit beta/citryl-CoA lyase